MLVVPVYELCPTPPPVLLERVPVDHNNHCNTTFCKRSLVDGHGLRRKTGDEGSLLGTRDCIDRSSNECRQWEH